MVCLVCSRGRFRRLLSDGVVTGSVLVGNGGGAVGDPTTPDGIAVVVGTTAGKLYRYTTPLP